MRIRKILLPAVLIAALCWSFAATTFAENHLKDLDDVRSSMTAIGNRIPAATKISKPGDMRTLERVFEINNYALMTIESYLKMLKAYSFSGNKLNKDIITLVNNWLQFIANFCSADIKYLDEARAGTQDKIVLELVDNERDSISRLMEAAKKGLTENSALLKE